MIAINEDVQRFFDEIPDDRRHLFDRVRALVESTYPEAKVKLSYGVPTYRTNAGWVAIGYWKGGVSVYTNGQHNIAQFKVDNPGIRTGTGSINLRLTDELPVEALSQVIKLAMEGRR